MPENFLCTCFHTSPSICLMFSYLNCVCCFIAATPGLGSLVYARMRNGAYSKGKVHIVRDFKIHIYIFEVQETIVHDTDDTTAVVIALNPRHAYMKRGNRVICSKPKGKQ